MKRQALSHPKMRRLIRCLGLATYEAVGILEVLWCNAEEHYCDGAFRGCDETDIADMVGWRGEPGQLVDALVTTGWLDRAEDGTLLIHDWADHCADHIHMRLARNNHRFADGRAPRTSRLPKAQRAHAERTDPDPDGGRRASKPHNERSASAQCAHAERTISAQLALSERTMCAQEAHAERTTQDPRPKTQDHTSGVRKLPYTPLTPHETSPPPLVPVENSVEISPEPTAASKAPVTESPPLAHAETASREDRLAPAVDHPDCSIQPPLKQNQPDLSSGSAHRTAAAAAGVAVDAQETAGHRPPTGRPIAIALRPNARKISKTDTGLQRLGDFAIEVTRRMLLDWMEPHADRLPPPDDEICRRLLLAHGMSLDRLRDWLLWLRRRGKRPESVNSWGWFAHLAEAEADGARDGPVLESTAAAGGAA